MTGVDITMAFSIGLQLLHVFNSVNNDAGVANLGQGLGEGAACVILR